MSAPVELEQALLLHRAEDRWLRQCADRLRRAATPGGHRPGVSPAEEQEEVR